MPQKGHIAISAEDRTLTALTTGPHFSGEIFWSWSPGFWLRIVKLIFGCTHSGGANGEQQFVHKPNYNNHH
jgi:hypothetical protein